VAICVPTYNQVDYLAEALESALGQEYAGRLEVWVGDDASTDGTGAVLDRFEREHGDRVHVQRREENVGIARNVSSLLRGPRTDLIVRLDSDDVLEPGFMATMAPSMQAEPRAGYGHSAVTEIDSAGGARRLRQLARPSGFQPGDEALRASLAGYRTVANILIFRRAALVELDFYEGRPEFVEDYDLAVRMADAGYGNVYLDEPLARYRVWEDDSGSRSRRKGVQLDGYAQIFAESIEPAWTRRGWDLNEVRRRRRALAAHNCAHCFGPQYSAAEREELMTKLRTLGDGPRLRFRLLLCRLGMASSIEAAARLDSRLRSLVKATVRPLLARMRTAG
jgi:glycosyltransferase involved in cell wall biosynthesis